MASAKSMGSSIGARNARNDQSVMGTNNSSIASKRSVERLYSPEPHFFRYFVKKPQRRAPLINRGYWLRMHAIDVIVKQFLEDPSSKKKVILNLGCGYDPLAFQWLSKIRGTPHCATFIDIDFPELMEKKSEIVSTSQLCELLGDFESPQRPCEILLRSENYYAVGCDLADTGRLEELLATLVDLSKCMVLCTAEVSITYMDVDAANSLIAWAARQHDIRFCLLEQYLPDGADHPFARKMIQHFKNLQTPLKNIGTYPKLCDQELRFFSAGWTSVNARSLWGIFCDPEFVSPGERLALDAVELFDEWEELVLFASHYFLLVAKRQVNDTKPVPITPNYEVKYPTDARSDATYRARASLSSTPYAGRRFGAIIHEGKYHPQIGHISGLGPQTRTATTDIYVFRNEPQLDMLPVVEGNHAVRGIDRAKIALPSSFEPRMCFTTSTESYYEGDRLLVGGRKSPNEPLKDCWLMRDQAWQRVDDLPIPLYRHCQTHVEVQFGTAFLVYGGKTSNNVVSSKWLLWRESAGWLEVVSGADELVPRYGAVMKSCSPNNGILLGGMTKNGTICDDHWEWTITYDDGPGWRIWFVEPDFRKDESNVQAFRYLSRFGASLESVGRKPGDPISENFLLIGGVANQVIPQSYEVSEFLFIRAPRTGVPYIYPIKVLNAPVRSGRVLQSLHFDVDPGHDGAWIGMVHSKTIESYEKRAAIAQMCKFQAGEELSMLSVIIISSFQLPGRHRHVRPAVSELPSPRPLLVGHSSFTRYASIIIIGGGAVCFSFGTYWNKTPISLSPQLDEETYLLQPYEKARVPGPGPFTTPEESLKHQDWAELVPQRTVASTKDFMKIVNNGRPVIIRNSELGPCITEWQSLDVVKEKVGAERVIIVHQCDSAQMDFQQKNFDYVKISFGDFIEGFDSGTKQYLRSLASENCAEKPANLAIDFPRLAADFHLPPQMSLVTENLHSSVLRISGFVNMWLHYDVMANVLCQIRGTKRLILFPPSDVSHLSLPTGSSTSSIDCFSADFVNEPSLAQTHPHEALLQPGDVLYLPPLWLHTASPNEDVSISVNLFFRNLESGYAPGRDVYGNRDVQAYEKGRQDIEKISKSFDRLPLDMRRFYLSRLADELKEKALDS